MVENPATAYDALLAFLDAAHAEYRILEHEAEGRTDVVSRMRGHPVAHAAKCLVLLVKHGKKTTRFVLAVVPGDALVDFTKVKALLGATYVAFAPSAIAEELARSVVGTVLPFAFDPALELIADPSLHAAPELYFNAARLDRSIALKTSDYVALAKPRFESIAVKP